MSIDWSNAPQEATHFSKGDGGMLDVFWRLQDGKPTEAWAVYGSHLDYYKYPTYTDDLFDRLIPRPTSNTWSGEGIPPVGTVCELADDIYGLHLGMQEAVPLPAGTQVYVAGHANLQASLEQCAVVHRGHAIAVADAGQLRPHKSPEQIATEECEKAIEILMAETDWILDRAGAQAVLAAGYRKVEGGAA